MDPKKRKVTVVGAGAVGSTYAYALCLSDEIAVYDVNENLARGQALDLAQGSAFFPNVSVHAATDADFSDADLVVVTAGARQKPGESRLDLLKRNADITASVARRVTDAGCRGILLIASNPVDILTRHVQRVTGWAPGRVIGSGTVLDSARFRHALSLDCNVDARSVHGYILGEHGDSEFAAWSLTSIAGQRMEDFCRSCHRCTSDKLRRAEILQSVRDSAYHIIDYKGATNYAIGVAMVRITSSILRDERRVLPVSTLLTGEFGIRDVCLSVPCIVGRNGVEKVLQSVLPEDERQALLASAERLRETYEPLLRREDEAEEQGK